MVAKSLVIKCSKKRSKTYLNKCGKLYLSSDIANVTGLIMVD